MEVRDPARTVFLEVPPQATAKGNLALASYAVRLAQDREADVSPSEAQLAWSAYKSEPLSISALGVLALSARAKGDEERAYQLLNYAGKLSRRSRLVTSQMIEATGLRNEPRAFFAWLSRAVLTDQSMRATYIRAMAEATARSDAVETLAPVIGPNPSWAEFYWRTVATRPNSLSNAAKLRLEIFKAPWNQRNIQAGDAEILAGLIKREEFKAAVEFAEGLGQVPPRAVGVGNQVVNGDFSRAPTLPGVDWQLAATGVLGASISDGKKGLLISAVPGAHGAAARQLVSLPGGNYKLVWKATGAVAGSPTPLSVNLTCAAKGQSSVAIASVKLLMGAHEQNIDLPPSACGWFWLSIEANLPDDTSGIDVTLNQISLAPVKS